MAIAGSGEYVCRLSKLGDMERLICFWVVLLGTIPFNASAQQKIAVEDVSMEIETTAEREHWCYNAQDFVSNSDGVDCHTLDMRHSVSIKEGQFIIDKGDEYEQRYKLLSGSYRKTVVYTDVEPSEAGEQEIYNFTAFPYVDGEVKETSCNISLQRVNNKEKRCDIINISLTDLNGVLFLVDILSN